MFQIGVRDAQPRQDRTLAILHGLGIQIVDMIVTRQMQNRMHQKMRGVIGKGLSLGRRLALALRWGDNRT